MPDQPPSVDPDDRPVFEALLAVGVEPRLAYTAVQSVRDVAAANLIAQIGAKLNAQNAEVRAQRWMIGAILALLGLGVLNFLAPQPPAPAQPQSVIVMPAAPAAAANQGLIPPGAGRTTGGL